MFPALPSQNETNILNQQQSSPPVSPILSHSMTPPQPKQPPRLIFRRTILPDLSLNCFQFTSSKATPTMIEKPSGKSYLSLSTINENKKPNSATRAKRILNQPYQTIPHLFQNPL
ncbi:hypothetical protein Pfo_015292 [Paulownia fortunei]|nr:hypothetical protein Pfo_015292 [Paulownia fortunei]